MAWRRSRLSDDLEVRRSEEAAFVLSNLGADKAAKVARDRAKKLRKQADK